MKSKQHFIVSLVMFGIMLFEVICYPEILPHPYMVSSMIILGSIGIYNLVSGMLRYLN